MTIIKTKSAAQGPKSFRKKPTGQDRAELRELEFQRRSRHRIRSNLVLGVWKNIGTRENAAEQPSSAVDARGRASFWTGSRGEGHPARRLDAINPSGRSRPVHAISDRVPFYYVAVAAEPYTKKEVRQAINYPANVDGVVEAVARKSPPVATMLPIWCFGYDPTIKPYPNDPQKAKDLLTQAGYPNGIDAKIWHIQGRYPKDKEVAEAMAQEMANAGIRCTPELRDSAALTDLEKSKQTPGLEFASWGNWFFDADNTFVPLLGKQSYDQYNDYRRPYTNPDLEKIIQDARVELDVDKRKQLYSEAQKFIFDDAPCLFMYQLVDMFGVDNWVLWEPRHDEMMWAHEMKWNV